MSKGFQHIETPAETPDEWHTHTAAEGAPQDEHSATANPFGIIGGIMFFGVVTLIVSIVVGVYLASYSARVRAEAQETVTARANYNVYRAQSDANLTTFGWAEGGQVALPIDVAKQKVIEQYQNSGQSSAQDSLQDGEAAQER